MCLLLLMAQLGGAPVARAAGHAARLSGAGHAARLPAADREAGPAGGGAVRGPLRAVEHAAARSRTTSRSTRPTPAGRFDIRHYYYPWDEEFPTWREPYDFAKGRYPLISWGCEDVDEILGGSYDALIDARADGLKALGKPLFLRWCWEMDGDRSEKSSKVEVAGEVHRGLEVHLGPAPRRRGADNVVRVWCPNARGFKQEAAQPFYPGDEWVDWICTDGYNWAPGRKEDWRSYVEIFDAFYEFGVAHNKPLMVGEWGAQERKPGEKAQWIADAQIATREKLPAIAAVRRLLRRRTSSTGG